MTVVLFYAERIIVFGERTFYQLTEIYTSMFKNPDFYANSSPPKFVIGL